MTATMSAAQQNQRNTEDYISKLAVLSRAAIGVILTRTREPFRVVNALREYAFGTENDFRAWTISQGWATYDRRSPEADPVTDGMSDPIAALKQINDPNGGMSDNGIYAMMYPHKPLAQSFLMVQLIKEYAQFLRETQKRLVLIVPPSFQLPEELEDDVVSLDFDTPSYAELRESYAAMMDGIDAGGRPGFNEIEIDRVLSAGAGMTTDEFDNALARAIITNRSNLPTVDCDTFASTIMTVKTEMVKKSDVLEVMEPGRIEEIGGLDNLKDWVSKRSICFSQEARDFGIEPPKGIALIGPPGTGKSLGAKAIASVLGIPALRFDVGRVFNSLVGQSEARVRGALKMVDAMSPCVLMIDEADKAFAGQAGGGGGGDSGVGMRVLGAILTWMQETKSPVFMVVTANRTANLPSEFLRRGRLDEIFSVTTPNEEERMEILRIHLAKRNRDPDKIEGLADAVARSAGYVGAELEAAVKDALIESFPGGEVTGDLIARQLGFMVPLSEAFKEDFDAMETWAKNNARPASRPKGGIEQAHIRQRTRPQAVATGRRGRSGADFATKPETASLDG